MFPRALVWKLDSGYLETGAYMRTKLRCYLHPPPILHRLGLHQSLLDRPLGFYFPDTYTSSCRARDEWFFNPSHREGHHCAKMQKREENHPPGCALRTSCRVTSYICG